MATLQQQLLQRKSGEGLRGPLPPQIRRPVERIVRDTFADPFLPQEPHIVEQRAGLRRRRCKDRLKHRLVT